ncbi:hypothetical protein BGZ50_001364, partial [Haplosporangium sp. Z 11]
HDHSPLPPVDPRSEDVYSLGVLIWRTFSGKSPWDGTIEDDLKAIRYLVSRDAQIKFQLEREVAGPISRELLLHCLTAQAETRWTTQQLKEWLDRPEIARELLREFEAYGYTLKQYATNARRHPTPCQKLYLVRDMISAMYAIHQAGLAHRDLSEVNIMVDEDPKEKLEDHSPKPRVKVIDFGKSVFVDPDEVQRWSMQDHVSKDELDLLPMVVLPPDHGYKLYRSILTLPKTKHDHSPLPP